MGLQDLASELLCEIFAYPISIWANPDNSADPDEITDPDDSTDSDNSTDSDESTRLHSCRKISPAGLENYRELCRYAAVSG